LLFKHIHKIYPKPAICVETPFYIITYWNWKLFISSVGVEGALLFNALLVQMVKIACYINTSWESDLEILLDKLRRLKDGKKTVAFAASGTAMFGNSNQTATGCQIA
jgi:hypothetical protein